MASKAHRGKRRPRAEERGLSRSHWRSDGAPKVRFSSAADANRITLQRLLEDGNDLVVYQCDICSGWHLGNVSRE